MVLAGRRRRKFAQYLCEVVDGGSIQAAIDLAEPFGPQVADRYGPKKPCGVQQLIEILQPLLRRAPHEFVIVTPDRSPILFEM